MAEERKEWNTAGKGAKDDCSTVELKQGIFKLQHYEFRLGRVTHTSVTRTIKNEHQMNLLIKTKLVFKIHSRGRYYFSKCCL